MGRQHFRGLYLQNTGHPLGFSFVTYTPQSREQMVRCGDLGEDEEYFSPVLLDFLLLVSEGILGASPEASIRLATTTSRSWRHASGEPACSMNI